MAAHPELKGKVEQSSHDGEKKKKKSNPGSMQSAAGRRLAKRASSFSKRGSGATYS